MAAILASCGKTVEYTGTPNGTPDAVDYCLINCEELPGPTQTGPTSPTPTPTPSPTPAPNNPIVIEVKQIVTDHNKVLCSTVQLHGSGSPVNVGCNNAPATPVNLTSKLKNSGDCQRVTIKTASANPGNFDTTKFPGHYDVCEDGSTKVWVNVENFNTDGVTDWNDALIEFRNVTNTKQLNWQWKNDKLYLCVE